jgi:hypothetical protein
MAQAAAQFTENSGVYLKQTTTDALLRNPKNKADDYDAEALKKFADPRIPAKARKRLVKPLPMAKPSGCYCHYFMGSLFELPRRAERPGRHLRL